MWHQHWCLLGILTSILVLYDSMVLRQMNYSIVESYSFDHGLQAIVKNYASLSYTFDRIGSIVCLGYWSTGYAFSILPIRFIIKYRAHARLLSEFLWGFVIRPYLLISILNVPRQSIQTINNIEYANRDIRTLIEGLVNETRTEQASSSFRSSSRIRMNRLQKHFGCCGLDSANDWISILDSPNLTTIDRPWGSNKIQLPSTCCDPTRSTICSKKLIQILVSKLNPFEHYVLSEHLPVFADGCLYQVTKQVSQQIQKTYWEHLLQSIILRLLQIPICFAIFYRTHPKRSKPENPMVDKTTDILQDINADEPHDDSDDSDDYNKEDEPYGNPDIEEINPNNEINQTVGFEEKQYHFFRGSTDYVSNAHLLAIFKSFPLFAQPSMLQLAFAKLKSHWLEKDMHIGWTFKHHPTHNHASFIHQLDWTSKNETDCTDFDKIRTKLRRRLPAMEAMCFADGSFDEKVESNTLYYGLISMVFRGMIFFLFSILSAEMLLQAFLAKQIGKLNENKNSRDLDEDEEEAKQMLIQSVAWISQTFVRITIVVATLISKRFRCLLLLLVPSLGLAVGQSFLGAELIHTVMIGPGSTIQQNLESASRSLVCLMELASNMTKDAKSFMQDTQVSYGNGTQTSFLNVIKEQNGKIADALKSYGDNIERMSEKFDKSLDRAKKAESLLRFRRNNDMTDEENESQNQLSIELMKLTKSLNQQANEGFEKQLAENEEYIKKMLSNVKNGTLNVQNMTSKLSQGFALDDNIRRKITASCLAFQQAQQSICIAIANEACGTLQTSLSTALWLPILVKAPCVRRSVKTGDCNPRKMFQQAKRECDQSKSESDKGVGWLFLQARDSYRVFQDAFHLGIGSVGLNVNKMFDWISGRKAMVVAIAAKTGSTIKGLFRLSLVLSQFIKLLCLLVFFKAHQYINKYMNDLDFDNIYVGTTFEHIDARRFRQNREVLLPLKSDEKKKLIWRTKKYTSSERTRVIKGSIKAVGLGLCMCLIFVVDMYIVELIGLLDEVTKMKIRIGDGSSRGNKGSTIVVTGKGVLTKMIDGFLQIVQRISELDLEYDFAGCSPKTLQTDPYYTSRFLVIWIIMLITALFSGYLLRMRHIILDFFYPKRMKRRVVHLYNSLLSNRRRNLTIIRNLLVNKSRADQLQEIAVQRSKRSLVHSISPQLAKRIGMSKMSCIICLEKVKVGRSAFYCPYDDTSTCRSCLETLFDGNEICVICLDRDPALLFEKDRELQKYRFLFGYKENLKDLNQ